MLDIEDTILKEWNQNALTQKEQIETAFLWWTEFNQSQVT
jgi:hypothetical protein